MFSSPGERAPEDEAEEQDGEADEADQDDPDNNNNSTALSLEDVLRMLAERMAEPDSPTETAAEPEPEPAENFACPVCGQQMSSKANLDRHGKRHNKEAKSFKCPICPRGFARNDQVGRGRRSGPDLSNPFRSSAPQLTLWGRGRSKLLACSAVTTSCGTSRS